VHESVQFDFFLSVLVSFMWGSKLYLHPSVFRGIPDKHPFSFHRGHFEAILPQQGGNSLCPLSGKFLVLALHTKRACVTGKIQRAGCATLSHVRQELAAGIQG
jgi:hypothetical protein